jgi:RNA polymerase sigma-70 factor, ECF subfamily
MPVASLTRSEAFETLMRSQERRVLRTALRLLGRLEDAQDAAQEVFLRLYRHFDKLDPVREIEPWLYRMTVNVCYDQIRKRRPVEVLDWDPPLAPSQEAALVTADRRRALELGLMTLSPRERAVVVLRDIEDLDTRQVAGILGVEEVTVRSQLSMARLKLRRYVESKR